MSLFQKIAILAAAIVFVWALIGCQTLKGVGEDLQWLGQRQSSQ